MAQLLVRKVDERLVRALKKRAAKHGVSTEEEHRRILADALEKPASRKLSLVEFLLEDGEPFPDDFLPVRARGTSAHRKVEF